MGGRAGLSQLLKIRVNRALQGTDDTTPAPDLELPALSRLPAPSVTRVQHLSETLDPLTGAPINLNVEDAPYLDDQTELPAVTTKPASGAVEDWLTREHDRGHASDPPAPRDLRGHRPKTLRRRLLRSREPGDHVLRGEPFPRSRTRTGARTRCRPIRAR